MSNNNDIPKVISENNEVNLKNNIDDFFNTLINTLNAPNSLEVYEIRSIGIGMGCYVIDCGARNKLGGMVRKKFYIDTYNESVNEDDMLWKIGNKVYP